MLIAMPLSMQPGTGALSINGSFSVGLERYRERRTDRADQTEFLYELRVLPLQFLQSFRLIQLQAAVFLSPAVVGLLSDFCFLAGLRGGLSIGDFHFDLPQRRHDLLRLAGEELPFA